MRAAVIGTGRMGRRLVKVVKELGLEVAGICDCREESLRLAMDECGISAEKCHPHAEGLLLKLRPEVVIIGTTAPSHSSLTCLAAGNGARYILCEKPMATSLEECDQMLHACREHGVKLAINHQMRFMEQYTAPKEIIGSEALGGLCSMNVVAGNFGMCMNGSHYFEAFRFISEDQPANVTAWFSPERVPNPRGVEFEDRAGCIRVVTREGKRFFMEIGADQGHGLRVIYGAKYGQVSVDEGSGCMIVSHRREGDRALPSTRYYTEPETFTRTIAPADVIQPSKDVLRALLEGGDYCSGEQGRLPVEVLVSAYVSHESNHREVELGEALPRTRKFPWA